MLTVHLYHTATLMFWFHRFREKRCCEDGLHGRCMYFTTLRSLGGDAGNVPICICTCSEKKELHVHVHILARRLHSDFEGLAQTLRTLRGGGENYQAFCADRGRPGSSLVTPPIEPTTPHERRDVISPKTGRWMV